MMHARHAGNVKRRRHFGDRILAVSLNVSGWKVTAIAVYMPHAGYERAVLDHTYDHLDKATRWAYKYSRSVVIGGDFNTVLHAGLRSEKLFEHMGQHSLSMANAQELVAMDAKWTFQSSLGVRRQLDYILVGPCLDVQQAGPVDEFCLNSDHSAVKATVINGASERRPQSGRIFPTQTWKPSADFAKRVDQAVDQLRPSNIPELEKVLRQEVQQGECEKGPEQNTFFHFPENLRDYAHKEKLARTH